MQTHNSRQRDARLQSQDRLNGRLNDQEVHHGRGRNPWQQQNRSSWQDRNMATPDSRGGIPERTRRNDEYGQLWGQEAYRGSSHGYERHDIDDMPDSRPYGRERNIDRSFHQSERFAGPPIDRGIGNRDFNDRGYSTTNDRGYNDRGYNFNDRNFNDRNFNDRGTWGQPNQEFIGKGPKGYMRSDERIREEVCELLSQGYLDASDIEVEVKDGEVTLTGSVYDRRTKRLAEEIAESASGVKDVDVKLKIKRADTDRNIVDTASTIQKKQDHITSPRETGNTSRRPNASA